MENHNRAFESLFVEELQKIYFAERQVAATLQMLIKTAKSKDLKELFQQHLQETKNHQTRLEQCFHELGLNPDERESKAIEGIIEDSKDLYLNLNASPLCDAALILAAQKIDHYEIVTYGTLRTYARHLDYNKIERLLQESLNEAGKSNQKLTKLAEGTFFSKGINAMACQL